jgi:hypothetical protein
MQAQMEAEQAASEKRMADLIAFVSRMGANQGFKLPATLMAPPPPPHSAAATPVSMNNSAFLFCICLSDTNVYLLQPPLAGSNNPHASRWNTPGVKAALLHRLRGGQGQVGSEGGLECRL